MPITKPGVYSVPIEEYHSQGVCDGVSVSSSNLRQIIHQSPAHFWAYSDLNPRRYEPKDKPALAMGRAAHALVLGEPEFRKYFVVSPFSDFRTGEARQWRDEQTRQIVRKEEMEIVLAMANAQRSSPAVMRAFTEGKPEQSLFHRDKSTGIWLKSRPDWFPNKPTERFICEYKSCVSIEPRRLSNDFFAYGYHIQAALALDVVEAVTKLKPLGFAHICQEKEPPYLAEVRLLTPEQIAYGREEYKRALDVFAHCLKDNAWPGYSDEPRYIDTPRWIAWAMASKGDMPLDGAFASQPFTASDYLGAG